VEGADSIIEITLCECSQFALLGVGGRTLFQPASNLRNPVLHRLATRLWRKWLCDEDTRADQDEGCHTASERHDDGHTYQVGTDAPTDIKVSAFRTRSA